MPEGWRGIKEVQRLLQELAQLKPFISGMRRAALYVMGEVAKYPESKYVSRASVYGTAFVSDKQRRWFFWAVTNGKLTIPYRRGQSQGSERFKSSWAIEERSKGLVQAIGSDTSYGPYLMDPEKQSKYMAARGWLTLKQVADNVNDHVLDLLADSLEDALRR